MLRLIIGVGVEVFPEAPANATKIWMASYIYTILYSCSPPSHLSDVDKYVMVIISSPLRQTNVLMMAMAIMMSELLYVET